MVNKMPEIIKNFQLSKIESNNYKRILNGIKKIKGIKSATINKEKNTLRIEVSVDQNERKAQARLEKVKTQITNAILTYEKKATIEEIIAKEVYRRVLYLNGLDCAHCATKIETIAKRELDYEKLLVDYTSFRFIIESSNKEQMNNIIDLVTKIAHKVDERIEVTEKVKKVEELKLDENTAIIFLADHGDALASHGGHIDKDSYLSEEVLRVPLLCYVPHIKPYIETKENRKLLFHAECIKQ